MTRFASQGPHTAVTALCIRAPGRRGVAFDQRQRAGLRSVKRSRAAIVEQGSLNAHLHFIRAKLSLVQLRIKSSSRQKFLTLALLDNRSFVQDENDIGTLNR